MLSEGHLLDDADEEEEGGDKSTKRRSSLHVALSNQATKAKLRLKKKGVLSNHKVFSKLKTSSIAHLLDVMVLQLYTSGQVLCKQKEEANRLFVLIEGSVYVDIENEKSETTDRVNTIESNSDLGNFPIFGESAILDEGIHHRTGKSSATSNITVERLKENYTANIFFTFIITTNNNFTTDNL